MTPLHVDVSHRAEQPCLGVRRVRRLHKLATAIPAAVAEVDAMLRAAGIAPHDDLVVHYQPLRGGQFALWIGRPAATADAAGLVALSLPAALTASTVHVGPYEQLADVTTQLYRWCEEQGRATASESWEVYHHLDHPDDPSTYRTTVAVRLAE